MARKSDPERAKFWRKLIERRQHGNLSVECVCDQAGVSTASFYQWQRKLRSEAIEHQVPRPSQQAETELVPVRIVPDRPADSVGMIEIDLPGGICLRVPSPCDPQTLRLVWGVLRDTSGGPG